MPQAIPLLFAAVACVNAAIGYYVLLHNIRGSAYQAFFVFSLGSGFWIGGIGMLELTHYTLFIPILNLGGLLLIAGLFRFAQTFPHNTARIPLHPFWYAPFLLGAFADVYPGLLIQSVRYTPGGLLPTQGPWFPYYTALFCIYTIASIALLYRSYRRATTSERMRFQYFFLGLGVFLCVAVLCDVVLPALGIFSLNFVGPLASVISIFATAYAIARHQFMDIRIVIQRSLIYSILLGMIIGLYVVLIEGLGIFLGEDSQTSIYAGAALTTLIGVFGVPIVERYFRKATNKIFFKDAYDYAETLHTLSEALHRNIEIGTMMWQAKEVLENVFHPETITLAANGKAILGPKRSGDPYTVEDERLLETFSHQAATAFERAQLYGQVKAHAAALEEEVKERTKELREAQENQQQMMIDISHNLQTPLTVFQTKLEGLKRTMPNDLGVQSFEKSLADLSTFIYDLLRLTQLEHEEKRTDEILQLSEVLSEIAEEMTIIAGARNISVASTIAPGIYIRGDAQQIREALLNIASNSIKYMGSGLKKGLSFSLTSDEISAILAISDTGIGIRAEDIGNIFKRFYRAQKTHDDVRGNGLGLAITKRIIEAHGGTITVESIFGEGTTMILRFPCHRP